MIPSAKEDLNDTNTFCNLTYANVYFKASITKIGGSTVIKNIGINAIK
jgi:hypothetical protein